MVVIFKNKYINFMNQEIFEEMPSICKLKFDEYVSVCMSGVVIFRSKYFDTISKTILILLGQDFKILFKIRV